MSSTVFTWTAKLKYYDRIKGVWKKPAFLTVTAVRMQTASRKATDKYRREYLNFADKCRASKIKLELERIVPS